MKTFYGFQGLQCVYVVMTKFMQKIIQSIPSVSAKSFHNFLLEHLFQAFHCVYAPQAPGMCWLNMHKDLSLWLWVGSSQSNKSDPWPTLEAIVASFAHAHKNSGNRSYFVAVWFPSYRRSIWTRTTGPANSRKYGFCKIPAGNIPVFFSSLNLDYLRTNFAV